MHLCSHAGKLDELWLIERAVISSGNDALVSVRGCFRSDVHVCLHLNEVNGSPEELRLRDKLIEALVRPAQASPCPFAVVTAWDRLRVRKMGERPTRSAGVLNLLQQSGFCCCFL